MDIRVGDWVAIYRDGHVVYARVEYLRRSISGFRNICTTEGIVHDDAVMEIRRMAEEMKP